MRWSNDEVEFLKEHLEMTDQQIGYELGCGAERVRAKRRQLGLGKKAPLEKVSLAARVEQERQKVARSFTEKEEKQLIKRVAMVENVVEATKEAMTVMPDFELPTVNVGRDKDGDEEVAVCVLSDTHAGKKTRSFNSQVFARRLKHVGDKVERLAGVERNDHPVRKLVVIMDGDMIDGEGIYPTQAYHVDQAALNQMYEVAVPAFVQFLAQMSTCFEEVEVHGVRGNHGRTGRFAEETSNWDLVLYRTLEIALANNPRVKFDITSDWFKVVEIGPYRIMVTHGHQIKSVLNLPFYGMTTKGMRWKGSVDDFNLLVIGHYHSRIFFDWNDFELMMNGTMVTGDEFAREVVGMESSCKQTLFFLHPEKKLITSYRPIPLEDVQ